MRRLSDIYSTHEKIWKVPVFVGVFHLFTRGRKGRKGGNPSLTSFPSVYTSPIRARFIIEKGFTLIELTIVIALMMILYAIATPSLRNLAPSSRLKSSAREIQSLLTYARDIAMTENVVYLVIFDLDEQRYWLTSSEDFDAEDATSSLATERSSAISRSQGDTSITEEGSSEEEFGSSRTVMIAGIPRKPATGVEIAAINITHDYSSYANSSSNSNPEFNSTEITTGTEYIHFTPKGTSEDMVLYLQDKTGRMMSVRVKRETGQVFIRKESQNPIDS